MFAQDLCKTGPFCSIFEQYLLGRASARELFNSLLGHRRAELKLASATAFLTAGAESLQPPGSVPLGDQAAVARERGATGRVYECTCCPPLAFHCCSKCRASSSERAFTPIRTPPSWIPASYCWTRSSGMPQSLSAPIRPTARPAAPAPASAAAMGPATTKPKPGNAKKAPATRIGMMVPIVPPMGPPSSPPSAALLPSSVLVWV